MARHLAFVQPSLLGPSSSTSRPSHFQPSSSFFPARVSFSPTSLFPPSPVLGLSQRYCHTHCAPFRVVPRAQQQISSSVEQDTVHNAAQQPQAFAANISDDQHQDVNLPLHVLLTGPPASVDPQFIKQITDKHGLVYVSMSALIRQELQKDTKQAKIAKTFADMDSLIPDKIAVQLLVKRLAQPDCQQNGWLLSGFPKTTEQGYAMTDYAIIPDVAIQLKCPDEYTFKRMVQVDRVAPPVAIQKIKVYNKYNWALEHKFSSIIKDIDITASESQILEQITNALQYAESQPRRRSLKNPPAKKVIIMGAPGSGKGTQCAFIVEKFGLIHLSTGDLLRAAVADKTTLGLEAKQYMDQGKLVPDDVVIGLIKEKLTDPAVEQKGWLLDGFPRTEKQAQALEEAGISPELVLLVDVPEEDLVERIVGRRSDPQTGKIYHVKFDPAPEEVQSRLVQRSDDREDKVRTRLDAYREYMDILQAKYKKVLVRIDGAQDKSQVFEEISQIIDQGDRTNKSMTVRDFMKQADKMFEDSILETEDVAWSGQAGLTEQKMGESKWSDLLNRPVLAAGDFMALLAFAAIGRASHNENTDLINTFYVAFPFLIGWFGASPLLSAYTLQATESWKDVYLYLLRAWAVSAPVGLAVRGVTTSHVPPVPFIIVSLIMTYLSLGAWRGLYHKINGPQLGQYRSASALEVFKMVSTLLRRW